MTPISSWILSILGVIILSILIDLILPEGKTSGFIKNLFGYIIIIAILSPVFSFLTNTKFEVNDIFKTQNVQIQEDFVSSINRQMLNSIEDAIEQECKKIGLLNVKVGISADIFSSEIALKNVNIDMQNLVIHQNFKHTNIKDSITEIVQKNISVKKEQIIFYE